jgi:hypothetical protein
MAMASVANQARQSTAKAEANWHFDPMLETGCPDAEELSALGKPTFSAFFGISLEAGLRPATVFP